LRNNRSSSRRSNSKSKGRVLKLQRAPLAPVVIASAAVAVVARFVSARCSYVRCLCADTPSSATSSNTPRRVSVYQLISAPPCFPRRGNGGQAEVRVHELPMHEDVE
jgi:hypothetical protein